MAAPVTETSIWRTSNAGVDFEPNASTPIMRTQNIVNLVGVITDWYKNAPPTCNHANQKPDEEAAATPNRPTRRLSGASGLNDDLARRGGFGAGDNSPEYWA